MGNARHLVDNTSLLQDVVELDNAATNRLSAAAAKALTQQND
jgi:hypothetical protein